MFGNPDLPAAGRWRQSNDAPSAAADSGSVFCDDPAAAEAPEAVAVDAGLDQDRRPGDDGGRHSRHYRFHQRRCDRDQGCAGRDQDGSGQECDCLGNYGQWAVNSGQ